MQKAFIGALFFFCLSSIYPDVLKEPLLLNLDSYYKTVDSPIINESYIVIHIQKQKSSGIFIYHHKSKKQHFISLKPQEVITNQIHIQNHQIFFTTSINKERKITFCNLDTYQLTYLEPSYQNLQFHFHNSKIALFTVKNKDQSFFLTLNLKTKKITKFNEKYQQISNVIQVDQRQAIATVSLKPNQHQIAFIDLKNKIVKEIQSNYHSITDLNTIDCKQAAAKLTVSPGVVKFGLINLEKKQITESPNSYHWMEYMLFPNKNILATGYHKSGTANFIFVDPFINQISEWPKAYTSIWSIHPFPENRLIAFVDNKLKITKYLHIDLNTKEIKETSISSNICFPMQTNQEKIIAYQLDKKSNNYALGFLELNTGIFQKKTEVYPLKYSTPDTETFNKKVDDPTLLQTIKNSNISYQSIQTDLQGRGVLAQEGSHNLFLFNTKEDLIHRIDKPYSDIQFALVSNASRPFGLATTINGIKPALIDFTANKFQEFNQIYQKIITNLRTNINKTTLASVLAYSNQETIIRFEPSTEQIIEYPVKEAFNQSSIIKHLYSLQPCPPHTLNRPLSKRSN